MRAKQFARIIVPYRYGDALAELKRREDAFYSIFREKHGEPRAARAAVVVPRAALFALGFIGAGMLEIPVLAGRAQPEWPASPAHPAEHQTLYGLVVLGPLGETALGLPGINEMRLLVLVAALNGVAAAPFFAPRHAHLKQPAFMGHYTDGDLHQRRTRPHFRLGNHCPHCPPPRSSSCVRPRRRRLRSDSRRALSQAGSNDRAT